MDFNNEEFQENIRKIVGSLNSIEHAVCDISYVLENHELPGRLEEAVQQQEQVSMRHEILLKRYELALRLISEKFEVPTNVDDVNSSPSADEPTKSAWTNTELDDDALDRAMERIPSFSETSVPSESLRELPYPPFPPIIEVYYSAERNTLSTSAIHPKSYNELFGDFDTDAVQLNEKHALFSAGDILYLSPQMTIFDIAGFIKSLHKYGRDRINTVALKQEICRNHIDSLCPLLASFRKLVKVMLVSQDLREVAEAGGEPQPGFNPEALGEVRFDSCTPSIVEERTMYDAQNAFIDYRERYKSWGREMIEIESIYATWAAEKTQPDKQVSPDKEPDETASSDAGWEADETADDDKKDWEGTGSYWEIDSNPHNEPGAWWISKSQSSSDVAPTYQGPGKTLGGAAPDRAAFLKKLEQGDLRIKEAGSKKKMLEGRAKRDLENVEMFKRLEISGTSVEVDVSRGLDTDENSDKKENKKGKDDIDIKAQVPTILITSPSSEALVNPGQVKADEGDKDKHDDKGDSTTSVTKNKEEL